MASHRRHRAVVVVAAVAQMCRSWAQGWLQVLLARPWVPQLQGGWARAQRPLRRTLEVISMVSSCHTARNAPYRSAKRSSSAASAMLTAVW